MVTLDTLRSRNTLGVALMGLFLVVILEGCSLLHQTDTHLATILFDYSGTINDQEVDGHGTLMANSGTGSFSAALWFTQLPRTFPPAVASFSLLSISCSNGGKGDEAPNILTLSKGNYTSVRHVVVFNAANERVGDFRISGRFSKVADRTFKADVLLTGMYAGPTDVQPPSGYDLPTAPRGNDELFGTTRIVLSTESGARLNTQHEQMYRFESGTTQPLIPNVMALRYRRSQWDPVSKVLTLSGKSVIKAGG